MSEKMLFCIGEGKYTKKGIGYQKNNMVFNVKVTEEEFNKIEIPHIKLPITKWVEEIDMTDIEKENNSNYKSLGGYLKTLSYKDAWKEFWETCEESVKKQFKEILHFNADIFEQITGIKIDEEVEELTMDEVCKLLGKNIKIKK